MNLQDQSSKRVRAVSARPVRSRPTSGSSRGGAHKTQLIENIYGGAGTAVNFFGVSNLRKSFHLVGPKGECQVLSKYVPKNPTKDKQQLYQQNLHLKKQIHKLTQQLAILKGQLQNIKKPINKANKQLNMQFQKQMYWTGSNTHLVAGVKARYQQLKQKYQQKCEQCQSIKNDVQYLQIQQFKIYSQSLQNENKRLRQKLQKFQQWNDPINKNESNSQVIKYMLGQSQQKRAKLEKKVSQYQKNNKSAAQVITERDKKIAFLQKLIIQKDNNQHYAHKKLKKIEKQKNVIQQQLTQTKKTLKQTQQHYETKIQKNKDTMQRKFQIQKDLFDRTLLQKQNKIQKLEKQVAYLSTLLSYWKPLDQANKQVADHIINKQTENKQQNRSIVYSNTQRPNLNQIITGGNMVNVKNRRGSVNVQNTTGFIIQQPGVNMKQSVLNKSKIIQQSPKKRQRQTAQKRYSEQAQKKRKVKHDQIEQIGTLLRYRFIAQNLSIQQVKDKFNFTPQQPNFLLEQKKSVKKDSDQQWNKKYISMKQAMNILQGSIFNLNEQQAWTLSRYLVEDCNNQYIYCDVNNQIQRGIIRSIIKNVVGDYDICDQQKLSKIDKEMNFAVQNYKGNLGPALKTVAPSGFTSKKKFLQMMASLGIQISDDCKEMFIAKMALQSEGLHKLKYNLYF